MTQFHSQVFQPNSAEELEEQMRRWDAGELDPHDLAVLLWKANAFHAVVTHNQKLQAELLEKDYKRRKAEAKRRSEGQDIYASGRKVRWSFLG